MKIRKKFWFVDDLANEQRCSLTDLYQLGIYGDLTFSLFVRGLSFIVRENDLTIPPTIEHQFSGLLDLPQEYIDEFLCVTGEHEIVNVTFLKGLDGKVYIPCTLPLQKWTENEIDGKLSVNIEHGKPKVFSIPVEKCGLCIRNEEVERYKRVISEECTMDSQENTGVSKDCIPQANEEDKPISTNGKTVLGVFVPDGDRLISGREKMATEMGYAGHESVRSWLPSRIGTDGEMIDPYPDDPFPAIKIRGRYYALLSEIIAWGVRNNK